MSKKQPTVTVVLPDAAQDAIVALADQAEGGWAGVASITLDIIAEHTAGGQRVNKTQLYADVSDLYRNEPGTIKKYTEVYGKVETWVNDYPDYGYSHWRLLLALAKRNDRELQEEIETWEATRDEYSGKPVPVRVLRAALAGDGRPATGTPLERARERLARAAVAVDKALVLDTATGATARDTWASLYPPLMEWCEEGGAS